MESVKVCHLSSVHTAGDVRIHKQCKALAKAGYEASFVVPYDREELMDGIRIRAVPRSRNRIERMTRTLWAVYRAALRERADVYHFHDPELMVVGLFLKLHGKQVVYDVHEDLPKQIMTKDWIPRPARRAIAGGARFANRLANAIFDMIIAATPAIAKNFSPTKVVIVQNFPILGEFMAPTQIRYSGRPPQIAYVGGLTLIRGVRELVLAMEALPVALSASLVIAGTFDSEVLERTLQGYVGWQRVRFLGWQSRQQVGALLSHARAGLVTFHPVPNHIEAQPNKLFEYMAAGLPVVASDFPLWRQIVEEAGAGLLVDPMDSRAIAEAIHWLLTHPTEAEAMGRRGYEAVKDRYNWEQESQQLLMAYDRLVKRKNSAAGSQSIARS